MANFNFLCYNRYYYEMLRGKKMLHNDEYVAQKLRRWEKFLSAYSIPKWNQLPALDLYMDQVIVLLTQYLQLLPTEERSDKIITSSIINNYVRMKLMPPPVKKKYSRQHLAYLIMICTLKQSLSISYIQKMLPPDLSEEELKMIYEEFADVHKKSSDLFVANIRTTAAPILSATCEDDREANRLTISCAIISNFSKLLAQKLLDLTGDSES